MKDFNDLKAGTNGVAFSGKAGVATLLPLFCALAVSAGPVQAQEEGASPDYKSQAHTSGVSLDMQYFYSTASHDGVFYRINLDTWNVIKTRPVHANLLMGSFVWNGDGGMM